MTADVCLVLEGTYPYVSGGVSGWTHDLLIEQSHRTFALLCLRAPNGPTEPVYDVPDNVVEIVNVELQKLPIKGTKLKKEQRRSLIKQLKEPIIKLQTDPTLEDLQYILDISQQYGRLGQDVLINSTEAFDMLVSMYTETLPFTSFLDYFWSWRSLVGGLFSILEAPIPEARCYHALCTGFAGLYLCKTSLITKKPCLLTEHGIYTNERRIEIGTADWLDDEQSLNFNTDQRVASKSLRDFWIDSFTGYSKLTYQVAQWSVTLYEGNKELQIEDGADPDRLRIIPNGIDFDSYSHLVRKNSGPPVIGFIGRVVPIKDIKTLIRAANFLVETVPEAMIYIMGPTSEDEDYYRECTELVDHGNLQNTVKFLGKVNIKAYLDKIDVLVLTSLSEAQPLVILEAGAVGVPSIATDVGSCSELIFGREDEEPQLGPGGIICPLASPSAVGEAMAKLLTDRIYYERCSQAIKTRVDSYYRKEMQNRDYDDLYDRLLALEEVDVLKHSGMRLPEEL